MMLINKSTDYWYMASPYSKYHEGREAAYEAACKIAASLMKKGFKVYSPIAHSHPIEKLGGTPNTHDFWLSQDYALLAKAKGMIVVKLNGWGESTGISKEINWATAMGIPVQYYEPVKGEDY